MRTKRRRGCKLPGIIIMYEEGRNVVRWVKLTGDKFSCLFCEDEGDMELPAPWETTK